jgi:hypothetical protein
MAAAPAAANQEKPRGIARIGISRWLSNRVRAQGILKQVLPFMFMAILLSIAEK